ncbi:MAG: chorismate mutase [Acetobacteraceae bacterium]
MPAPLPAADDPPNEPGDWGLEALRDEIDRLDEGLHELLIERSEVVARLVRQGLKTGNALRPGREAEIIRRRLAQHRGPLPRATIVRIWRELLAGTTAMQGAFTVALCEADAAGGYSALAREHFGALTPLRVRRSAARTIAELATGATVAVLPFPAEADQASGWWQTLGGRQSPRARIIARLPFWTPRPEGSPPLTALVLSTSQPDPSSSDRSLLGLTLPPELSRARLIALLHAAGFVPGLVLIERDRASGLARALAEVGGFVKEDDPRLPGLDVLVEQPLLLGAYAIPVEPA